MRGNVGLCRVVRRVPPVRTGGSLRQTLHNPTYGYGWGRPKPSQDPPNHRLRPILRILRHGASPQRRKLDQCLQPSAQVNDPGLGLVLTVHALLAALVVAAVPPSRCDGHGRPPHPAAGLACCTENTGTTPFVH